MKRDFKLTIPNPCSQTWSKMSVSDGSRMCQNCNKNVVDFTNYSDQQLHDFFIQASGKVCGRLTQNQVDKFYSLQESSQHRQLFPQLLVSVALTFGIANKTEAKEEKAQTVLVQTEKQSQPEEQIISTPSNDSLNYIFGKIIDNESRIPLPFVSILIQGTNMGVSSDTAGNFKLLVSDEFIGKKIILSITYLGYEKKEMELVAENLPIKTEVVLLLNKHILMGDIILYRKPSLWQRIFHEKRYKHECK